MLKTKADIVFRSGTRAVYACVNLGEACAPAEIRDRSVCIDADIDEVLKQFTLERECLPLLQIRDAYPKKIIAGTRHPKYGYEGIEIYNIVDWLLQEE